MTREDKINILLVEDEAILALTQKKQLEKWGYLVQYVFTGEKAIQTISDSILPVDLVLMDINLGSGIDGTEAAQEIVRLRDIPVVFLSSHTEQEVVEKTEKITSYGYVVKNSGTVVLDASIKMAFKLFHANEKMKHIQDTLESTIENLGIHQIELQMQNDELCGKQEELEALRKKYNDLYDLAPVGYFSLTESSSILEANCTGLELLGYTRDELVNQPFTVCIPNEDQDKFYLHRRALFEESISQTCELRMKRKDGSLFPVYIKAVPFQGYNDSPTCLVIMIELDVPRRDADPDCVQV